jgi:uncharacterized cupin superfamily protein
MEHVRIDDVDSYMGPADVTRPVARALATTNMGLNYYELGPGDSMAYGFHAHSDQEEVFYVQSGAVTFRTEDGDVTVEAGEIARFEPGAYQRGTNRGEERAVVLAIGAPKETGETEILVHCDACGEETPNSVEMADDRSAITTVCENCGTETARYT